MGILQHSRLPFLLIRTIYISLRRHTQAISCTDVRLSSCISSNVDSFPDFDVAVARSSALSVSGPDDGRVTGTKGNLGPCVATHGRPQCSKGQIYFRLRL